MGKKKQIDPSLLPELIFSELSTTSKTLPATKRAARRLLNMHLDAINGHREFISEDFNLAIEEELRLPHILTLLREVDDLVTDEKLKAKIKGEVSALESERRSPRI